MTMLSIWIWLAVVGVLLMLLGLVGDSDLAGGVVWGWLDDGGLDVDGIVCTKIEPTTY
jgi:hypothetical protein